MKNIRISEISRKLFTPKIGITFLGFSMATSAFAEEAGSREVYELSPFAVSADSEVGYLATETLSGTRMRSQIGDLAASIEVLTEEFLRDIGAVEMYDALDQVGNVSTWGQSGGINENENAVWFSSPYMARGFQTSAVTSDFFELGKIPLDFYNRTNITVARGPNAILYGIGSPGGIVNATRNRPLFGSKRTELQVRTDSHGSLRSTFDVSRELIDNKLAVRVSLLYDDRREFLKPAGHLRRGAYGALTYQPYRGTSLTIMAERGTENRTFRFTTTAHDAITHWMNAGSPTYSGFDNNPPINQAIGNGLTREPRVVPVISGQPEIPILNWQNMARSERFRIAGYPATYNNQLQATGFTAENAVWDYRKVQLTGKSRQRDSDWTDYAIFLTQQLFVPELNLELAYNRTETDYMFANAFGHFFLQMDANELLPNGDANPNFMVPYVQAERTEVTTELNNQDTFRSTLSYMLDLSDRDVLGMGLGRYNFFGLYEHERINSKFASFRRAYQDAIPGFPAAVSNPQNQVRTRSYLDTYLTPEGANVLPYFVHDWTLIDRDGASDVWFRHTSPRDIIEKRDSYVLALQAFLWQSRPGFDRLILTAGYRVDRQTSQRKEYEAPGGVYEGAFWRGNPFELDNTSYNAIWDGTLNYGTWGEGSLIKEPTKTYSAVFKLTDSVSFFYNYSDVMISPSALFTDIYDNFLGPTYGKTTDIGTRLDLFGGKVNATFTVFETSAEDQRENNVRTIFTPQLNQIWAAVDPAGDIHQGFNERYVTLRDDTSKGFEFSLTANPVRGWTARLSISRIETTISSRLPVVTRYLEEFSPLWESFRDEPLNEANQQPPNYMTVGDAIDTLNTDIANLQSLVGTRPDAQREWKVVFNTGYQIRDGALSGWGIGGGVRWESADIIGYAFDQDSIADASRPVIIDSTRPFRGEELLNVSSWISYTRTVRGVWMRFQLNVNNLFDESGTFPRSALDDMNGNPMFGRQQVRQPRTFVFTTTFRF